MSKQGMARPDRTHVKPKNDVSPVPEIQGKAKHGKEHAKPIVSGTNGAELKVFHSLRGDGPISIPSAQLHVPQKSDDCEDPSPSHQQPPRPK